MVKVVKSENSHPYFKQDVIVIGETGLCLECCKLLDNANYNILAVVSEDKRLENWCQEQAILCIRYDRFKISEYKNYILFSIVNPKIISLNLLKMHKVKLAINYHDSLLPAYAGVSSTTWAIINQEKTHGATWHKVVEGIDEGDILKQAKISINSNETAHSLNLKCTVKALQLFKELLVEIRENILTSIKQNIANKSYYGIGAIPHNYGILNYCNSLDDIYKYCRALFFGKDHNNPVGMAKLKINKALYLVTVPEIIENENNIKANGFYIIGKSYSLYFPLVMDIYGQPITLNKKITLTELKQNFQTFSDNEINQLGSIKRIERRQFNIISSFQPINSVAFSSTKKVKGEPIIFSLETLKLNNDQLISAISLALLRTFQDECLVTTYVKNNVTENLRGLIDTKYFIPLHNNLLDNRLSEFQANIKSMRFKKVEVSKDYLYRYNLSDMLSEIAIYLDDSVNEPSPHRLKFFIENSKISIIGDLTDEVIINAVAMSLKIIINNYSLCLEENLRIKNINLLPPKTYQKIIVDWNETDKAYTKDKTICALFEAQVEKTPNNIAVSFENEQLSYSELNVKGNQLARYIRAQYFTNDRGTQFVKNNSVVAICLPRSIDMIIAILGVLKAGAVYVPIDPDYPKKRIDYILDDTNTKLLLTHSGIASFLGYISSVNNISILELDSTVYQNESSIPLPVYSKSDDLAYIIYTSGTTGKPKGVMIKHKGIINLISARTDEFKITCNSHYLLFVSICFDPSVQAIFITLFNGAALHILPAGYLQPTKFCNYVKNNYITHTNLPSSFLAALPQNNDIGDTLQVIGVGAETCDKTTLDFWAKKVVIINSYGPTEITACATSACYNITNDNRNIGKPIANVKTYVLDHYLQPVPVGVVGELYLTGPGLAVGYLNNTILTNKKFIHNPFCSEYKKIYATGDLVTWNTKGELLFVGRKDTQVKLNGYRIELEEIKNTLLNYEHLNNVVICIKNYYGRKVLIAYYTSANKHDPNILREFLEQYLPIHMIPNMFIHIAQIPLTHNQKINYSVLPDPEKTTQHIKNPTNNIEEELLNMWKKLLSCRSISIDDNFFMLGGDSLLAFELATLIEKAGFNVTIKDIYMHNTIGTLSKVINIKNHINKKHQVYYEKSIPLSAIQHWFFEQNFELINHWDQAQLVHSNTTIDRDKLQLAVDNLCIRYPILNTEFNNTNGELTSSYIKSSVLVKEVILYSKKENIEETKQILYTQWQSDFDIKKGMVFNIGVIKTDTESNDEIFLAAHHLIVDIISWGILIADLEALYYGKTLASPPIDYQQYCQLQYKHKAKIKYYFTYFWQQIEDNIASKQAILFNQNITKIIDYEIITIKINNTVFQKITQYLQVFFGDSLEETFILALYSQLLADYFNIAYLPFIIETHGRDTQLLGSNNTTHSIGWYTCMYPLLITADPENNLSHLLTLVQSRYSIPDKGMSYTVGKYLIENNEAKPDNRFISFNYTKSGYSKCQYWKIDENTPGITVAKQNHLPYQLTTDILNYQDTLTFTIKYNRKLNKIENDLFIAQLERLPNLCRVYEALLINKQSLLQNIPLHHSQARYLYYNKSHYNIYCAYSIYELLPHVETNKLINAIQQAIQHTVLEYIFFQDDTQQWKMKLNSQNLAARNITINQAKKMGIVNFATLNQHVEKNTREINLENTPWQAGIVENVNGQHFIYFIFHHLLMDRGSATQFFERIYQFYYEIDTAQQYLSTSSYIQFCYQQNLHRNNIHLHMATDFWHKLVNKTDLVFPHYQREQRLLRTQMKQYQYELLHNKNLDKLPAPYTPFYVTLYAFYSTLQEHCKLSKPLISIILNGKYCDFGDRAFNVGNSFGWKSITVPFALENNNHSINDKEGIIKCRDLIGAMPWNGHSYGINKYLNNEFSNYIDNNLEFNFTTQHENNHNINKLFEKRAAYFIYDGNDTPEFPFYLYIVHKNNTMRATIQYDPAVISRNTLEGLMHAFKKRLHKIMLSFESGEKE